MKNIFRFLGKHKLAIFAAICCLVVQAYCDLALPTYTSDVLNVGLQQGGKTVRPGQEAVGNAVLFTLQGGLLAGIGAGNGQVQFAMRA